MYEIYFKKIEEVLDTFPVECRTNYYENKKSVKIEKKDELFKNLYGTYDHEKNEIEFYRETALPHELFHMAFRDKEKVEKKIFEDSDIIYGNGISYSSVQNGKKNTAGKAITEGFAEYLSRKCSEEKGNLLEFFFIDLLISIYGEEIICYALKNNSYEFFTDERFNDIMLFSRTLDSLYNLSDAIKTISRFSDTFKQVFNSNDEEEKRKLSRSIFEIKQGFKNCVVKLFEIIVNEYNSCNKPKISKDDFILKLEEFSKNTDYQHFYMLDDSIVNMTKEINKIIKRFSKGRSK